MKNYKLKIQDYDYSSIEKHYNHFDLIIVHIYLIIAIVFNGSLMDINRFGESQFFYCPLS